jgi:hypothetical protein
MERPVKRKRASTTEDSEAEAAINDQIQRLRQLMLLMAPETGTSALGGSRDLDDPPVEEAPVAAVTVHHH